MGAAAAARSGAGVQLRRGRRSAIAAALAAGGLALAFGRVLADTGYLQAVRAAETILARPHVSAADVRRASSVLAAGVGCSQPEIADDLAGSPPATQDAGQRLQALDRALSNPPRPTSGVEERLRGLAGRPPYQREQPESPGDLLSGWVQGREAGLQAAACGGLLPLVLQLLEYLAVAVVALAAAIFAYRRVRGRSEAEAEADAPEDARRLRGAGERFAAADRLAAAGHYAGALRELASAVATALGGEATWEASPLTVRELYARAGLLGELRPLLRGFEDAVYGHRAVTAEQYRAAAAAASPYRAYRRRAA